MDERTGFQATSRGRERPFRPQPPFGLDRPPRDAGARTFSRGDQDRPPARPDSPRRSPLPRGSSDRRDDRADSPRATAPGFPRAAGAPPFRDGPRTAGNRTFGSGQSYRPGPRIAPDTTGLACLIIQRSGRDQPADRVLRDALRETPGARREQGREVSRRVFAYFRWRAFVDAARPLARQTDEALELAGRFAREPGSFTDAELARALPAWVADRVEVTPAWCRALQAEPALWLRARPGDGPELAALLRDTTAPFPALPEALRFAGTVDLFRTEPFQSGRFELQDIASQLVGLACAPQPGGTWWDACAGEGGKTLHLSDLMQNRGLVWASDRSARRLATLKLRSARARCFNYRAVAWDGGLKLPTGTKFDGVLLDAPCTGLGTWGRNPHARWTVTPADVGELATVQTTLLRHAAPAVKPGGRLIYAVCTLTRAETLGVADAFAAESTGWEPAEIPAGLAGAGLLAPAGAGRWWAHPETTGGNGMFVAAWCRAA
ncbi:MAG: RsmB/NOP family class I SAM-dependent RNA methyltransferase [Limisphaerales bacterium]